MYLVLTLNSQTSLMLPVTSMGPLVASLSSARIVERKNRWDTSTPFVPTDKQDIEMSIIRESDLAEPPEPIKKAMETAAQAQSNWLREYGRAAELEKELKALKDRMTSLGIAFEEPKAATKKIDGPRADDSDIPL